MDTSDKTALNELVATTRQAGKDVGRAWGRWEGKLRSKTGQNESSDVWAVRLAVIDKADYFLFVRY